MIERQTILVVEDSPIVMKIIRHVAHQTLQFDVVYANSFEQAKTEYETHNGDFFAAIVDLNLPDAPDGEVVDYTLQKKVPTIVLTGSYDEQRRETLLNKGIVDYVTKEGRYSYDYAINLINRLHKNQFIKVLVVEDSTTTRKLIASLLKQHLYQVLEAGDGVEAIRVVLDNPDIKLLITDYNMPNMDGFELVKNLRVKYEKSDLVIIGLSADGKGALSAKFIKNGANDFLQKPFFHEELHCRVMHNIESLELIEHIRDTARRDQLTGCFNRHYFLEQAQNYHQYAQIHDTPLAAVVLDLDDFSTINDDYGYDAGDQVLREVTSLLQENFDRFLLARSGGGEFFLMMPGINNEQALTLVSKIRQIMSSEAIVIGDQSLFVNFSAGVTNQLLASVEEQLNKAGEFLVLAKEAGRHIVVGDDDDGAP